MSFSRMPVLIHRLVAIATVAIVACAARAEVTQEKTDDGYVATFRLDTRQWDDKPTRVNVAGSFNGWNGSATALTDDDGDGIWTAALPLDAGGHSYKFVIDGDRWITDPTDDAELREGDNYGGENSGVVIGPDVRKAPPPEPNAINGDFVRYDPTTDFVAIDNGRVRVTVWALAGDLDAVGIMLLDSTRLLKLRTEGGYDIFQGEVSVPSFEADYYIVLQDGTEMATLMPSGLFVGDDAVDALKLRPTFDYVPRSFDVPDWAANAVWYQIFPERFRNGESANDPGRFSDYELLVPWNGNWWEDQPGETPPSGEVDNFYQGTGDVWNRRYGGDLQGVYEQLPYLRNLGVNAIYFNPIFEAESMHKYDTADFRHVDDNFGIAHHGGTEDTEGGADLSYPPEFGEETDDPATWVWSPSDIIFLDFIDEAHRQGFKVVIDGVFNHVGRAHPFFQDVLENGQDSRYADWFEITDWGDPANWKEMDDPYEVHGKPGGIQWKAWDQENGHLPVFKKDAELGLAPGPREHIFNITRRWLDPDGDPQTDDGIDGWRLDVPGDIPHPFWRDWRKVVKETKPEAYITGEIWPWAEPWLQGDQFDAVMNYQFAMTAQDFFIDESTADSVSRFNERLIELTTRYPRPITYAQQNLMDSHDTDRLASMFVNPDRPYDGANRPQDNAKSFNGPLYSERKPDAEEWARMIQLVNFQHTFVGAPMTYYGNEAGMWSPDDPSNRQPLPWKDLGPYSGSSDGFDNEIFAAFQRAIAIRNSVEALRTGDFEPILIDDAKGLYAFARTTDEQTVYVVLNRSGEEREAVLPVVEGTYVDYLDPEQATINFVPLPVDARPFIDVTKAEGITVDNELPVSLPAWGTAVFVRR